MKSKIILLIFSLFFASVQFFGQSIKVTSAAIIKTSEAASGNQRMKDGVKVPEAQTSLKSTGEINEELRLEITCDANSYSDEVLVIFNNSDPSQGAAKLMSMYATAPELWSVKNGLNYSISFMGNIDSAITVPLSMKAGATGSYTITASQVESFGVNSEVSLEDRVSGSIINMGIESSYTFQVSEPAIITDRFYLHFLDVTSGPGKEITSVPDRDVAQNFNMYSVDGAIRITSLQKLSGKVLVTDMVGRTLATGRIEAGAPTQINIQGNTGVYIVSVLTSKGRTNTKVIVR